MAAVGITSIAERLRTHAPQKLLGERFMKNAAVAVILRQRPDAPTAGLEVLLIRRAEHPRDPWSGHMAFPGGRVDDTDESPLHAAVRETREEVAFDLDTHGRQLGELSHILAMSHGKPLPMAIAPYVFAVEGSPNFAPNAEVQEALWVPLDFFLSTENRGEMDWSMVGRTMRLPCYRYEGRVIWGLTLKMLDELLALLRELG